MQQVIRKSIALGDRRIWTAALASLLVVGGGYGLLQLRAGRQQALLEAQAPVVVPVARTVTALGRLEPAGEIIALAPPSGGGTAGGGGGDRLLELRVQAGGFVEQGQVVAVLDNREANEVSVLEAQQQVAIAQADLAKVKAGAQQGEIGAQEAEISRLEVERMNQMAGQEATIRRLEATRDGEIATQQAVVERLRAELANARADAARYADLFNQGAVSASQRDSFRLAGDTAQERLQEGQANLARIRTARQAEIDEARSTLSRIKSGQSEQIRSAEATLDRINEVRPVDIQIAEAQVKATEASLKRAEVELEKSFIKSPQSGVVLEVMARPGETISGDGLLRLAQTQDMRAIAEVYESDIQKLELGQPVTLTSPSLPDDLQGQVSRIGLEVKRQDVVNTDPAANIDARVVEVEIGLDEDSIEQVQGFSNLQVTATIQLDD